MVYIAPRNRLRTKGFVSLVSIKLELAWEALCCVCKKTVAPRRGLGGGEDHFWEPKMTLSLSYSLAFHKLSAFYGIKKIAPQPKLFAFEWSWLWRKSGFCNTKYKRKVVKFDPSWPYFTLFWAQNTLKVPRFGFLKGPCVYTWDFMKKSKLFSNFSAFWPFFIEKLASRIFNAQYLETIFLYFSVRCSHFFLAVVLRLGWNLAQTFILWLSKHLQELF